MKKIFTAVLAICMTISASASTGAVRSLEQAVNEYEYSLTVDWDQNDKEFRDQATRELSEKIKTILSNGSVSREELLSVVEKRIHSKEKLDALMVKIALLPKSLSEEQQVTSLLSTLESGSQGASWNGDVVGKAFMAILVSGMILVLANTIQQGECLERSTELEETCDDGGCYEYYPCIRRENESWW